MKKSVNIIVTVGALCAALADAGNLLPNAVHGYVTLGAIVCAVLAKSPLFNESN